MHRCVRRINAVRDATTRSAFAAGAIVASRIRYHLVQDPETAIRGSVDRLHLYCCARCSISSRRYGNASGTRWRCQRRVRLFRRFVGDYEGVNSSTAHRSRTCAWSKRTTKCARGSSSGTGIEDRDKACSGSASPRCATSTGFDATYLLRDGALPRNLIHRSRVPLLQPRPSQTARQAPPLLASTPNPAG